jgi:hypothetical protein
MVERRKKIIMAMGRPSWWGKVPATAPLSFGKSVQFNGATSYISASKGTMAAAVGSISVWVYSNIAWESLGANKTIATLLSTNGFMIFGWNAAWGLEIQTWTAGFACIDNPTAEFSTVYGGWPYANTWSHVVFTWNGTVGNPLNAQVYLDTQLLTCTTPGNQDCTTIGNLRIGGGDDVADASWDGYMDEFAMYSRVLTAAEILDIYHYAIYPVSGLVTRYNFDEASGNALDLSGNGNHGTLSNVTRSTTVMLNGGY